MRSAPCERFWWDDTGGSTVEYGVLGSAILLIAAIAAAVYRATQAY